MELKQAIDAMAQILHEERQQPTIKYSDNPSDVIDPVPKRGLPCLRQSTSRTRKDLLALPDLCAVAANASTYLRIPFLSGASTMVPLASVVTAKPAIRGHFKTGHRDWPKT